MVEFNLLKFCILISKIWGTCSLLEYFHFVVISTLLQLKGKQSTCRLQLKLLVDFSCKNTSWFQLHKCEDFLLFILFFIIFIWFCFNCNVFVIILRFGLFRRCLFGLWVNVTAFHTFVFHSFCKPNNQLINGENNQQVNP